MLNKKNFLLNCEICDTRRMKEDDYSGFEKMLINAEIVIVNEASRSILNRLPVTINHESMVELPDDIEVELKTVNGSYEITGSTAVPEHTLLLVNGPLRVYPGTEAVLEKYEKISVNGSVRCPKSLEGYLSKMSVNGSVITYPDDCVILDKTFIMDKYFPLRAKEGSRYYVEKMVVIRDKKVDLAKLVQKHVQFVTKRLIVPECMVEDSSFLFDEQTDFVVVPEGMGLIYGDAVLDEQLVKKEGSKLYVYGSVKLDENCDMDSLGKSLEKLIVKGTVTLRKSQEETFRKLDAEYERLEIVWEGKILENCPRVSVDRSLLEASPKGVFVRNAAIVKVAEDVTPELILDKLKIANCAMVSCREEQESAVAAVAENVAKIGGTGREDIKDAIGSFKDMLSTKMINAENYVM